MRTFFRFFILMALLGLGSLGLNADATLQGFSRSSRLCGVNSLYLGLKAINQPMDYALLRENFPSANDSGVSLSQLADFLAQKNIPHKLSLYKSRTIALCPIVQIVLAVRFHVRKPSFSLSHRKVILVTVLSNL